MADWTGPMVRLAGAAAECTTIDELAEASLACLDDLDVDAAVWSRFGSGRWHRIGTRGSPPEDPGDESDGWRLLTTGSAHRTTVLGLRPSVLPAPRAQMLATLLQAGLRRLEAEASADSATQAGEQRLATILDATPDAVVVVALDGQILDANSRATDLFGYTRHELVGASLERLLPEGLRDGHREHRDAYAAAPTSRPMAAGQDLHALHRDGSQVPVDIALEPLEIEGRTAVAAFVRDATARRRAEEHRQHLAEAQMAQHQALEINDNVVQGLTSAIWLLEVGEPAAGLDAVRSTLQSARAMMADLLERGPGSVEPGMLQRATAVPSSRPRDLAQPPPASTGDGGRIRVVVADDSEDLRLLLGLRLQDANMEVVASVGDGQVAIEAADEHRPDVVIMDLSMPVLDGLQATSLLRDRHPQMPVVVLSGHPRDAMLEQALDAGADAYVQKGGDFQELIETVRAQVRRS